MNSTSQLRKVIVLLGPPGSGKGTQAVRLSSEFGLPHISTGDLFRENLNKNTELGKKAKGYMEKGQLVPDTLVLDMLFDRVARADCNKGYLLDGFPRTIPQAEAFDKLIDKTVKAIVLNLDVKDEVIVKRAAGRLTCSKCGHIHNIHFSPPKMAGKCDKCNGELIQRPDDNPAVVTERLKVYHTQTLPLVAFYKKKGYLKTVDGEKSPDVVFKELTQAINA